MPSRAAVKPVLVHHHVLIRRLVQEVRDMRAAARESSYYQEERESRHIGQAAREARETAYREQEAQANQWYREDQQRRLADQIQRAAQRDDHNEVDRLARKMKNDY